MTQPRLLATLLLGLLLAACQTKPNFIPEDPHSIRSVSFNIRYGSANDGDNNWQHRKQLVVDALIGHAPDLFGLQESLNFQTRYVADAFPNHELYGPGRRGPDTEAEAVPILWRKDRFEALATGTFWLSTTPNEIASVGWDAALPRICSWARLQDRESGYRFIFANTHFDHRGQIARNQSATLIANYFPGERVLLMGDFNSAEYTQPMQNLRTTGYKDTFRVIHPAATDVGTFTGFADTPRPDKIDHIYLRGQAIVLDASIDKSRPNGQWPSDHLPVLATFQWDSPNGS